MAAGRVYLVPNLLGVAAPESALPARTILVARELRHVVAENAKVARAFLKSIGTTAAIQAIAIEELNERTPPPQVDALLDPTRAGSDLGLMSDAGCPGVADPGARLVAAAHRAGIQVIPLVGPSSILLALMASGMNGQGFTFHGYLPAKTEARTAALRRVEELASKSGATQLFIETPYRNVAMLQSLIALCANETLLGVAADLTLASEEIVVLPVTQWRRRDLAAYQNRPAIFLLGKAGAN
ncbi:MAG: SAM-dependent methyltransferase [Betaproteobacteria bacterium]|nr:SAM-dependent methyltransferase [Betaproteobacteria bacterium]